MTTVLVVDDERHAAEQIVRCLTAEGYQVVTAADGPDALDKVRRLRPGLVVLDLMLPSPRGIEICRRIRQASNVPVIILSAWDGRDARLAGFAVGADDYLAKPFNPRELAARMKAVLRRQAPEETRPSPPPSPRLLKLGELEIDLEGRDVEVAGKRVHLARKEFDVLVALAEKPGAIVSREALLARVWCGGQQPARRTTDVHVAWLRGKLQDSGVRIQPVWGVGYRLVVEGGRRTDAGDSAEAGPAEENQ